jgi:hypothetical protein
VRWFFQLTNWPIAEGKGVDDYLAGKAGTDPAKQKDCLDALKAGAQPFFSTLRPFMLPLVEKELEKVAMSPAQRSQLWVMFTWVHPQMDFSPILYVTGPWEV